MTIVKFSETSFIVHLYQFFLTGDTNATVRAMFLMTASPFRGDFLIHYILFSFLTFFI